MDILKFDSSNLQDLVFFLLPGFVLVYLFFYLIPDRKKSDLTIIVLGVVASALLTYLTAYFLVLLDFITNVNLNLTENGVIFNYVIIMLAVLLAIVLSRFVQSKIFEVINKKILNVKVFPFGRLWNVFFKVPENTAVKVFLNSGICYIGVVRRASFDPEDDVQELELWKPFYFDKKTAKLVRIEESESVLIQGSSIVSIEKISKKRSKLLYK